MSRQSDLIGNHPKEGHFFTRWLSFLDLPVTATKNHRSLTSRLEADNSELIEWFGKKLFFHHHSEERIERLKSKFASIGFRQYADQNRRLPIADKTMKGNATEILLVEYVETCAGRPLAKVFRLRYNSNVDQSMKGDDALLIDVIEEGGKKHAKVYLGEAKFRSSPTRVVIEDITKSLAKDKKPTSYTFVVDQLLRDPQTKEIASILDGFLIDEIIASGKIVYTGFLLSNDRTSNFVEDNLSCENPDFVLISLGINNPELLISGSFTKAQHFVDNPHEL